MKAWNTYFVIFFALLLFGYATESDTLKLATKPLIMPSLAVMLWVKSRGYNSSIPINYIFIAFFFSWLGDLFLMGKGKGFFLLGMLAFLIAHLCYIYSFVKNIDSPRKQLTFGRLVPLVFFAIYGIANVYLFFPRLGPLKIPVTIYIAALLFMVYTALFHLSIHRNISSRYLAAGALLFMISDNMIGMRAFYMQFPYQRVAIMFTYVLAQYLILMGVLRNQVKQT